MKTYVLPPIWDARKFAIRYGLQSGTENKDYYIDSDGKLVVFPTLPDDPPIFDLPDPFVPVTPGVAVHHWPEMSGWVGAHKLERSEVPGPHHECYYIVADTMAVLEAFRAMPQSAFQPGQVAYILGPPAQFVIWGGSAWAGIRMEAPMGVLPTVNAPNSIVGTNASGIVTVGAVGTTNIVVTFGIPYTIIPVVAISWSSNLCQVQAIATLTNVTFKSNNNQINGKQISYICQ